MNFLSTVEGSLLENFYPAGWDLAKLDRCVGGPDDVADRQPHWNEQFSPVMCEDLAEFEPMMGHEIALQIKQTRDEGRKLALILPVGPMGMYKWVVYFLKAWSVDCAHVSTFNMDEWSDAQGNTPPADSPASFQRAMERAFFEPMGAQAVPPHQRNFATGDALPQYAQKIAQIRSGGGKLVLVYGVGRAFHIAFWEPHFAAEYDSEAAWRGATHRIAAMLHPLTIEQNALTSFKSLTTLVPCRANTIGPGLFLQADYAIGGCDGVLSRGMQWQGLSFWATLRYGPDRWVPSSFMPTLPGKLFFHRELAGARDSQLN